jgi:hypothetical protein
VVLGKRPADFCINNGVGDLKSVNRVFGTDFDKKIVGFAGLVIFGNMR